MSYLLIENQGVAEIASLTLMGASTKRADAGQIGMFGTGNKYALSVLLREGCEVVMFFGTQKIVFSTEQTPVRGQRFNQIIIEMNGEKLNTNFTTEMGLNWKIPNALREFISNAMDEGEFMVADWAGEPRALAGSTRIFIKMTPEIRAFYKSRGEHFLKLRSAKPLYSCSGVEMWPRMTDKCRFYRRGVLVFTDDAFEGLFDYNFDAIPLAEDRTCSKSDAQWEWCTKLDSFPREVKKAIMENIEHDTFETQNPFVQHWSLSSDEWKTIAAEKIVCPSSVYDHAMKGEVPRESFIRTTEGWSTALRSAGCRDVKDFVSKSALRGDTKLKPTTHENTLLLAALDFLKRADVAIDASTVCLFSPLPGAEANIMGYWDSKSKTICINQAAFVKGLRFVVEVLLEEAMHRDSGFDDKTRAFQTFLFERIVNEMEKRLGPV